MQSLALKENLQVNTKALIYILFTNNNICSGFAMCAHKRVLEDVWLFKTLWWLELVYRFKGSHFILFFIFYVASKYFCPGMLTAHTFCVVNTCAHVGNKPQKWIN